MLVALFTAYLINTKPTVHTSALTLFGALPGRVDALGDWIIRRWIESMRVYTHFRLTKKSSYSGLFAALLGRVALAVLLNGSPSYHHSSLDPMILLHITIVRDDQHWDHHQSMLKA
jgi:hypothetical protein